VVARACRSRRAGRDPTGRRLRRTRLALQLAAPEARGSGAGSARRERAAAGAEPLHLAQALLDWALGPYAPPVAIVTFPDGPRVRAASLADRREDDPERAYGLYLDARWAPTW